jgi:predicted NBD/HSP70 family sugar kinase
VKQSVSNAAIDDKTALPAALRAYTPAESGAAQLSWEQGGARAQILAAVFRGHASSRKDLVRLLRLRSTTVSEMVGDLLGAKLVAETIDRRAGRGRPSLVLVGNPHRMAVLVFTVASQTMNATCLNLLGQAVAHDACELKPDCGNEAIGRSIEFLGKSACTQLSSNTKLVGTVFSLPGLVDAPVATWVFSSRWPTMDRLDMRRVMRGLQLPVIVCRNLDAELQARLDTDKRLSSRTMLFHWGYGIGAALASDGKVILSGTGGFGEVGHWRWANQGKECRCGRRGCLETTAALWALGPVLLGQAFDPSASEESIASTLREMELLESPAMVQALNNVVSTLANLCRVVFPKTVVISGPFVSNARFWNAFRQAFLDEGILTGLPSPELIPDGRSASGRLETIGAAGPLLMSGLEELIGHRE